MKVTLADTVITVEGWTRDLDKVGEYTLKVRKTPEEMKAEKDRLKSLYGEVRRKINPIRKEPRSVLYRDEQRQDIVYFLPGLWPRVKRTLEKKGIPYEITDMRNPDIRPEPDYSVLNGVELRENQDVALALLASSDCGIIETATGFGKCHHGDELLLMYNGSSIKARDVKPGMLLMGDDSTPRRVLNTTVGHGPMYKFTPVNGDTHIFNSNHVLSLVSCSDRLNIGGKKYVKDTVVDVAIEDYLKLNKNQKHLLKAYRTGVDFPYREEPELDPYFVGVYLGDGTQAYGQITNADREILDYCENIALSHGWHVETHKYPDRDCYSQKYTWQDEHTKKIKSPIVSLRKACGMQIGQSMKRITDAYRLGSRHTRLQVLAGILDTDGYLNGGSCFEVTSKFKPLAEDIAFIARSLGLAAYIREERKTCTNTGVTGTYYRVKITGNTDMIPTKLPSKQAKPRTQIKDVLHTGFELERIQDDEYYGFAVDGNHRYLMYDFTVTHNSFLVSMLCKMYPTLNIVVTTSSQSVVQTLYGYLCEACPGEVGVKYAGKDTTRGKRIVVVTLKSLSTIPPENVHMLLCDECHNVGDGQAGQDIMQFCFARKFGFSASPVRNDGSGRFMEALFGPTILEMGYEEAVEAGMVTPLKYHMLPIDWGPDMCKKQDLNDVLFKRFAYWRNTARNKAIQRLVYDIKQVYGGQILIMVNTLEHAIRLHMLLPWFTVLYYGVTDMADLRKKFPADKYPGLDLSQYKTTAKQVEIGRAAFAKGTLRFIISTKILKQGVNAPHLQVLIRADADVSEVEGIQIPGRLARLCEGKDYAYLIDCADNFSQRSKSRSEAREALYQKQKWQPITREALINELRQSQGSTE